MARMTGTNWVGPHHDNGLMTRYDVVCIHTIVGNPPAHAAHFSTRADGWIYQSRDTTFRSAANYQGNHRVIAVENDDHGTEYGNWDVNDGHQVPWLTDAQIDAIAKICVFAYQTHGVPLIACPDSRPDSRGIAYHRQGIDGNWAGYAYTGRVTGGEIWTLSNGKVCPGDRRIAQLPTIIARARQLAGLDPLEDDVPLTDADTNKVWMQPCAGKAADGTTQTWPAVTWLTVMAFRVAAMEKSIAELAGRDPLDVDEAAVAVDLAPMLIEALSGQLVNVSDADLERIGDAVADENARRLQE